jgi:hypothetical protein
MLAVIQHRPRRLTGPTAGVFRGVFARPLCSPAVWGSCRRSRQGGDDDQER